MSFTATCAARPRRSLAAASFAALLATAALAGCSALSSSGSGAAGTGSTGPGLGARESTPIVSLTERPAGWPAELPLYPGSKVLIWQASPPKAGRQAMLLSMRSEATPAKIVDAYEARLARAGWKVERGGQDTTGATTGAMTVWLSATRGGSRATVMAVRRVPSDQATAVAITVVRTI